MRAALAMVVAVVGCSKASDTAPSSGTGRPAAAGPCAEDAAGCEAGCDAGRLEDCHELAWRKKAGKREGCPEGTPEYEAQVRKDCAGGDFAACAEIAHASQDGGEAMRAARQACDRGQLQSTCGLVCNGLRDGMEGAPDLAAARACFDRVCKAGEKLACEALASGPTLGGGCAAIDMANQPHLELTSLPRLSAPDPAGGTFDSAKADKKPRLYLFTASWNAAGKLSDLAPLAAELSPLGVELVAVLSDDSWEPVRAQLEAAESFTAVLDAPAPGENIGRYTSKLGITKVPEGLVVDAGGKVLRHLVGPGLLTSRLNSRRCVEDTLKRPE